MTRVKISTLILAALIGMSIFASVWVNKKCSRLIDCMDRIEQEIQEDKDTTVSARELEKEWTDFRKTASVMIRNDKLTEPERVAGRITLLAQQSSQDLPSAVEELRHMTRQLMHGETPKLTSVL
ncbi:MAG TPA: DUF4363 family protein [Ruminococcus flavefaciens]|nr:DUF4363 family protein [Ruminococcus flavefaciens]